ncbi:MAG: hypothetical protein LBD58_00690 [Treponema sp.]|nr:hypothetical protein [Treponema sp.]
MAFIYITAEKTAIAAPQEGGSHACARYSGKPAKRGQAPGAAPGSLYKTTLDKI